MNAMTKPQKILSVMYDLCGGKSRSIQYEDIVVAAFERFGEDFQLRGYPQFPDASDIHKPLYEMKKQGLVRSANKKFQLTARGLEVARAFTGETEASRDRLTKQEEDEIKRILSSQAFRLHQEGQTDRILDTDFYAYLGVSVRTRPTDFQGRLSTVQHAIDAYCRKRGDPLAREVKTLHGMLIERFQEEIHARD